MPNTNAITDKEYLDYLLNLKVDLYERNNLEAVADVDRRIKELLNR